SFPENAAKEAFEEAGVVGNISPTSIGMYRAKKRSLNPQIRLVVEVWIYLLEVTEILADWPEKHKREIRWVSCEVAAQHLREPVLAHLCHRIARVSDPLHPSIGGGERAPDQAGCELSVPRKSGRF